MMKAYIARGARMELVCRGPAAVMRQIWMELGGEEEKRGKLVIGERLSGGGKDLHRWPSQTPLTHENGRERAG